MVDKDRTMIWPAYLDSKKTQKEGRKIPISQAVSTPKIREINRAAAKLGLNPQAEKGKSYSKSWWEKSGRIFVDKKFSKREVLLKISNLIKASRS
ncbi:MAG TPA: signal recognition particle protein Srp19 [Methanobacteriaceae archaeon]|nr:signal recognition particle protein Srp19 [Methanobacteriaceae archaeon]